MGKVYVRAGMSPLIPMDIGEAIDRDMFGANTGNLVYQYSVFRLLMREDTDFDARLVGPIYNTPGGVERLGEECDMAVIPLANAFRRGFGLKNLTDMIRRLKIPCVIIGCGLQANSPEDIKNGFPFDEDVKNFISAALDKSALVGLRGEFTGEYLKRLGFVPEKHFTVIGCPSMFLNGAAMPEPRVTPITPDTHFSINTREVQRPELNRLMARTAAQYPEHHLLLQKRNELRMLGYDVPILPIGRGKDRTGYYPFSRRHRDVKAGRVLGFTEARTWFDFIRGVDYSFGSRIHGNMAAVINGVPAFVFTSDTRTEELCRYGNIPHMPIEQLKDGADIRDILEKADFRGVCRDYDRRFDHFLDFLNLNGVDHIYRETKHPAVIPFDEAMKRVPVGGLVKPGCVPEDEAAALRKKYYKMRIRKKLGIK